MRFNGLKWGQIWPNWTKPDQAGPNRAKPLPMRVKQGQTRLKKAQLGFKYGNLG